MNNEADIFGLIQTDEEFGYLQDNSNSLEDSEAKKKDTNLYSSDTSFPVAFVLWVLQAKQQK